jgi:aspartate racemase
MHVGLFSGIGPAATDYYYRRLIALGHRRGFPLELTMAHADSPTLLGNLAARDVDAQVEIFVRLAERLARAGAEVIGVTAISGHFCIDEFTERSPLPVSSILEAVSREVAEGGFARVGLLGTAGTMESRFFGGIRTAEVLVPEANLAEVHEAYIRIAASGTVDADSRRILVEAGRSLVRDQGAETVLLGGTDLVLVMDGPDIDFPVVDCAGVHVNVLAELAEGGGA